MHGTYDDQIMNVETVIAARPAFVATLDGVD